jgi:predicted enzyme related to lactoylglutathione lyase
VRISSDYDSPGKIRPPLTLDERTVFMGVELTKDSVDIGIIVRDGPAALAFYKDFLGLEHLADTPIGGGGTMHRLMAGTSMIKVVEFDETPDPRPAPGGLRGGSGYRYWTMSVSNIDQLAEEANFRGYAVPTEPTEIRPGVRIAMIEDPDGNWVELLENTSE